MELVFPGIFELNITLKQFRNKPPSHVTPALGFLELLVRNFRNSLC